MYFSSISLQGFKSFLDETVIPLEVGLTGIVGPNGCGKSNVVEALRWVMGESNARKMRGDDMDDIIFMGTSGRAPRNLAEVALTIVNDPSHGPLPHPWQDLSELTVSRVLGRGEGSRYRINGKEVRSKDVQYLFMARATGSSSASMVAQGRVSNIINARAGERRLILEEAAGVRALSARRHESELKLEAASRTLEEVAKIIDGLETSKNRLLKEAAQAEKYSRLSQEITALEGQILTLQLWLQETSLNQHQQNMLGLQKEQAEMGANESKQAAELADLSEQHLTLKTAMEKAGEEVSEADRLLTELRAEEKRYKNELLLNQQRHADSQENLDNAVGEINQSAEQERVLLLNCDERERKLPEEEATLRRLQEQEQALMQGLHSEEARLSEQQQVVGQLTNQQSKINSEQQFLQTQWQDQEKQLARKKEQLAQLVAQLAASQKDSNERDTLTAYEQALKKHEGDQATLSTTLEKQRQTATNQRDQYQQALQQRQQSLHDNQLRVKEVMAEMAPLQKMVGGAEDLLSLLTAEPGFEKALAVALSEEAESGLDDSKQQFWQAQGRTALAHQSQLTLPNLLAKVSAPAELTRNLGLTYWVKTFDEAKNHQSQLAAGEKIVSQDGGLVRWDGFTIKPSQDQAASRRLAAKNRLTELAAQLPALTNEEEKNRTDLTLWQEGEVAKLNKTTASIADMSAQLTAINEQIETTRRDMQALQKKLLADVGRYEQWSTTKNILSEEITTIEAAMATAQKSLSDVMAITTREKEKVAAAEEMLKNQDAATRIARQKHIDARLAYQQQLQLVQRVEEELKNLRIDASEVMKRKQEKEKYIIVLRQKLDGVADAIGKLQTLPSELLEKITFQERTYAVKKEQQAKIHEQLLFAEQAIREKNRALKEWQDKGAAIRETMARVETHISVGQEKWQSLQQASEGKDLPPRDVVEAAWGKLDEETLSKQDATLKDKIAKRERLGAVNLLADQQLQEMASEADRLTTEKKDLDEAIEKLHQAIDKLNSEAREKIATAFHQVNDKFAQLFKVLFGGGEASLYFDSDADPLTAGLEFTVHPPGKKPGPLSLLSGGEQTLTALALIFAVMDMNPPPIAVLDEVDAPLDDANIHRFTQLLRQRKADNPHTRYLVITHHRLTMARMDRLFGVTMAEKGVSTIVGVNLETAAELAGKKVA